VLNKILITFVFNGTERVFYEKKKLPVAIQGSYWQNDQVFA
jgi:hypothetical protein